MNAPATIKQSGDSWTLIRYLKAVFWNVPYRGEQWSEFWIDGVRYIERADDVPDRADVKGLVSLRGEPGLLMAAMLMAIGLAVAIVVVSRGNVS